MYEDTFWVESGFSDGEITCSSDFSDVEETSSSGSDEMEVINTMPAISTLGSVATIFSSIDLAFSGVEWTTFS